jgi:monovalent cation:H+ antiporter-2, CPA2 family
MPHHIPLISTLASALGLALVLGVLAIRLRLPALVGYLVAGVLIGPFTPGFIADTDLAAELAEIGVMLLMFGVGLHFSLSDLLAVRRVALPGAVLQIAAATVLGGAVALAWGWSWGSALVFGLALSVASTVVLLRALETQGILDSNRGRIAVGWLVVEDLAMVLVLVLLPPIAEALDGQADGASVGWALLTTLAKVSAFIALMLVVGRRILPKLLWIVAGTGSRELFTLCVVAAAVTIAFGASETFGVSFALGAFFAGMVIRESEFAHRAVEESLPLREAFAALFFVSVGMLFDPMVLIERPLQVLAVIAIIVVGKTATAAALVVALRYPLSTALTVSAGLAQIGEFSFILTSLGVTLNLLPPEGQSLILAGALISIAINPLVFRAMDLLRSRLPDALPLAEALEHPHDPLAELPPETADDRLTSQIVLVGYGRVGRRIGEALEEAGLAHVVADQNRDRVERLRARGIPAVVGDASEPAVLIQARIARAAMLVVATPDTIDVRRMIENARSLNPAIAIVVRTHNEEEAAFLKEESAERVFLGEEELAHGMIRYVLDRFAPADAKPQTA